MGCIAVFRSNVSQEDVRKIKNWKKKAFCPALGCILKNIIWLNSTFRGTVIDQKHWKRSECVTCSAVLRATGFLHEFPLIDVDWIHNDDTDFIQIYEYVNDFFESIFTLFSNSQRAGESPYWHTNEGETDVNKTLQWTLTRQKLKHL